MIICRDCSAKRSNTRYKNTLYCASCRLLRDFLYVGDEQRPCTDCKQQFAPVTRKDVRCGGCNYGSVYEGRCAFCANEHAELHRAGVPVCVRCIRKPSLRKSIVGGLRKGQAERRQANHHAGATA